MKKKQKQQIVEREIRMEVSFLRCPHCRKLIIGAMGEENFSLLEEWKKQKSNSK